MPNNLKTALTLIYFLVLLAVGYYIFPFWLVVLSAWVSIYAFIKWRKLDQQLNQTEQRVFTIVAIFYPVVETVIKHAINANWIPYSWEWLNRLEHFGFSTALGILLLPLVYKQLAKLDLFGQALLYIGFIIMLGNLNEFAEYLLRVVWNLNSKFALYYLDTIADLFINVCGGITSFVLYKIINQSAKAK
jgi:hypothetical protein